MEYGLVAVWLAAYLALGATALPTAAVLFRWLPGRGAGVALPLSLVLVAVPAYWVGRVAFGLPALAVGLLALVGAGAASLEYFDAEPDWTAARDAGAVFVVAFGFMVAVRAVDPAVHPILGEKFLDFGLLRALLRAPTLPPEDFWFAGEPVQYYYGGHLVAALLTTLTGTAPAYAYNLALAGFYGALVVAAFGVGGAIAASRGASRRAGGLAGAFMVGVASNLSTPGRFLAALLPDGLRRSLVGTDPASLAAGLDRFNYWPASRVIEGTINEFPLFAWLNGDMHAHMMSQPFALLVAALLFSYFRTPAELRRRRRALVFGCVPVVGGFLGVVNTWSFPTVAGMTAIAVLFAPADPTTLLPAPVGRRLRSLSRAPGAATDGGEGTDAGAGGGGAGGNSTGEAAVRRIVAVGRPEGVRILAALAAAGGVLLLSVGWGLPFFAGPASGREVALLDPQHRSPLSGLLLVHGGFLLVFVVYLRGRLPERVRRRPERLAVSLVALLALGVAVAFPAAGLFVPLIVLPWALVRRNDGVGFEGVLLAGGAGLALLVEVVYVVEQAGPVRMNTVFKTYSQVWVLWGTAAGALFGVLVHRHVLAPLAAARAADAGDDGGDGWGRAYSSLRADDDAGPRPAAVAAVLVFVASLSLYAGFASLSHFTGDAYYDRYQTVGDPTLNATAFVEDAHPEEAPAIRWLDRREGTPTIVTAAPGGYRWSPARGDGASAPSSLTGVPTVAGWFHERGYRGSEVFSRRVADVETIYTGDPGARACLLAQYDVEYVYVGPAETAKYGEENVDFSGVEGVGEPIRRGGVRIYPVDPGAIDASGC